jgi:hypothetical protein
VEALKHAYELAATLATTLFGNESTGGQDYSLAERSSSLQRLVISRVTLRRSHSSRVDRCSDVDQLAVKVQVFMPERKNLTYPHTRRAQHKADCPNWFLCL